jgi:hypothetical protein
LLDGCRGGALPNPKSETRNPKEIRKPKREVAGAIAAGGATGGESLWFGGSELRMGRFRKAQVGWFVVWIPAFFQDSALGRRLFTPTRWRADKAAQPGTANQSCFG